MKIHSPMPLDTYLDPDVRIMIMMRRRLSWWHLDTVNPPYWRLYWNSTPGATIAYQGKTIALSADRLVLIPPNTAVIQRLTHSPITHFYAHFLTKPPFCRLHSKVYTFAAAPMLVAPIKKLPANDADHLTGNLNATMAILGVIHFLLAQIPFAELQPLIVSSNFEDSLAYIDARLEQPLTNAEIARHMGISVSSMLRRYQAELGISPQAYLRRKRIEKACFLLYERKMSIEQIAAATGFCDRYYFSKMLKKFTSISPGRLRAREFVCRTPSAIPRKNRLQDR